MNQIVREKKFIESVMPGITYNDLSQSYLRAETQLTNLSSYAFQLQRNNVRSPIVTERLLELNDKFVISHFRVGLKFIGTDTPSDLQQLNANVDTYADPAIYTGNSVNAAGIFNSSLSFTINRRVFLPQFPCASFRRVPVTQTGAILDTAGTATTPAATFTGNSGLNGYDNGLYGFYPSEPTLIDGKQTLDINLTLNNASAIDDTSMTVYAVFEVRGYLVVNAN